MKIALCFAGQPRFVSQSYDNIMRHLIVPNKIEDIFVHTWWRDEFETIGYPQIGLMYKSSLNFIENNYKPKKMMIENDTIVALHPHHLIINNFSGGTAGYREPKDLNKTIPGWYSRYKVNCIKNEYKSEIKLDKYDAVIVTRFDVYMSKELKLDNLDLNVLNAPFVFWKKDISKRERCKYVGDILNVSNEKIMDIYAEIYNNMPEISKHAEIFVGESLIGHHLLVNNIKFIEPWTDSIDIKVYRSIYHG